MSDDRAEVSARENRERSYGIRLFFALVVTTVVNAIIQQVVHISLLTSLAVGVAVSTASWYAIVQRWSRAHPK